MSMTRKILALAALALACAAAFAQQGEDRQMRAKRMLATPNPLAPSDSPWIDELTYMEVRDRIASGATTAIVPTGGIEENGPFLATGKHNVILRTMCPAIVAELGNAMCAPVVPFVPEGSIDPPSGAMLFPGSISVRDETYQALLEDIGNSLRQHGFTDIVFIGDSGGNQRGMKATAEALNRQWRDGTRAHFIAEFYTSGWSETERYTEEVLGVAETKNDGHHDDIWVTALMMASDPSSVRYEERLDADLASINGVDISNLEATVELGRRMAAFRAKHTAEAIRLALK